MRSKKPAKRMTSTEITVRLIEAIYRKPYEQNVRRYWRIGKLIKRWSTQGRL